MNKRQAQRLAAKITKDPSAGATVTGLRIYTSWKESRGGLRRSYGLDLQDHATGYIFEVGSPQDWADRQEAREFAAQHGA